MRGASLLGASFLGAALWALLMCSSAFAQEGDWRPLSAAMVQQEIEWRLGLENCSYATIWNAGYDIYRLHYRNQDTAMAIHLGYMGLLGRRLEPEQRRAIRQAAIYWQKVHDYGITNVPVGVDENNRGATWYGSEQYLTTLRMRRPKGGPVPMRDGDRAPSKKKRRAPYKGRPDNPYPGPYYPGVYPP
ncbi:MAG: hypothetical protein LBE49_01875 [Deltaproteobacteria bacterium]|nr:hypothetical protein [Deltaproteobacteria bacterium]